MSRNVFHFGDFIGKPGIAKPLPIEGGDSSGAKLELVRYAGQRHLISRFVFAFFVVAEELELAGKHAEKFRSELHAFAGFSPVCLGLQVGLRVTGFLVACVVVEVLLAGPVELVVLFDDPSEKFIDRLVS